MLLVSFDYSQLEMRLMAIDAGCVSMLRAFEAGEDIHGDTMYAIWGIRKGDLPEHEWDAKRTIAKNLGFGIIYGVSAYGFHRQNRSTSVEEADQYIQQWLAARPEVRDKMEERGRAALEEGSITDVFGRVVWVPEVYVDDKKVREEGVRTAINSPTQGAAATLIKMAMIDIGSGGLAARVEGELRARGLETRMLLQVHDELIFEVPVGELSKVVPLIKDLMAHAWEFPIPMPVEAKGGMRWGYLSEEELDRAIEGAKEGAYA